MADYPVLPAPGVVAGVIGRWLAGSSRFGMSRFLVGLICLVVVFLSIAGLSLVGN